jgi:hypothetical protein
MLDVRWSGGFMREYEMNWTESGCSSDPLGWRMDVVPVNQSLSDYTSIFL